MTAHTPDIGVTRWGADSAVLRLNGTTRRIKLEAPQSRWQQLAEEFGRGDDADAFRAYVRAQLPPGPSPAPHGADAPASLTVYVREQKQRRADVSPLKGPASEVFREAFAAAGVWVEWPGHIADAALLDIDFHGVTPPRWATLQTHILTLAVRPLVYWRSHGGGGHLLFVPVEGYAADELAAACAVDLAAAYPFRDAKFEVIARTRHPLSIRGAARQQAGPLHFCDPCILGDVIKSWSRREARAVSPDEIETLKAERGWAGKRAAGHDSCPFDPAHKSHSAAPVFIGDGGVSCQSCKGRGLRHFAPWAELIDGAARPNVARELAHHLVDWSHARLILADDFAGQIKPADLRRAYFALAKFLHSPADPRIPRLSRNPAGDYIRGVGCWLDPLDLRPAKLTRRYHSTQPANTYIKRSTNAKGDVKLTVHDDQTAIERAGNDGPIPGWVPIIPVRGMKVWGVFNDYPAMAGARRVVNFRAEHGNAPRYIPADTRMPIDEAWRVISERFPGVSRAYLELLIVARGFAESGAGRVPRVLVTGPSGSAKSTTARLAAAIVGDVCRAIPYVRNFRERFDAAVTEAGFLLCDEFAKPARAKSGRNAANDGPGFAFFLDMESREYSARLLYVGPVQVRLDSVVVVTGTGFPPGVMDDVQVARRFVHVALTERTPAKWENTCGFSDVGNARRFLPEVCDAIVSDVIDRFFIIPEPGRVSFEESARALGFDSVEDTMTRAAREAEGPDGIDPYSPRARIRQLFELVCSGEGSDDPPARYAAKGRRCFGLMDDTDIAACWRELADDVNEPGGRHRSERIDELDLVQALGFGRQRDGVAVRVEIRGDGRRVAVRFIGSNRKGIRLVNEEIRAFYKKGVKDNE